MVVTYLVVAFCVIGVLGAVASVLSYDNLNSKSGSEMRIPKHSRRGRQRSRPSRQLQAVEAALADTPSPGDAISDTTDATPDQQASCSPVRSRGRSTPL